MSQTPRSSPAAASPLAARLYDLEYPRSLGVYNTYEEVQSVVDTLADNQFPVQSTLIVGTDLKLMERVTGRKTWGRVIGQGVLSGLWMGLFLGLLLMLLNPGTFLPLISSMIMGVIFFTLWQVVAYALTRGQRDFTSMTATIPMQYELLVEHKHAEQARQLLASTGASPVPPQMPAPAPTPTDRPARPSYGLPAEQSPQQPQQPSHPQQSPQPQQQSQSQQSQAPSAPEQRAPQPPHES